MVHPTTGLCVWDNVGGNWGCWAGIADCDAVVVGFLWISDDTESVGCDVIPAYRTIALFPKTSNPSCPSRQTTRARKSIRLELRFVAAFLGSSNGEYTGGTWLFHPVNLSPILRKPVPARIQLRIGIHSHRS